MDRDTADHALNHADTTPVFEGPVSLIRERERQLLAMEIPSRMVKPPSKACCGTGGCGCGAKLQLIVRTEDVTRVQQLMQREWLDALRAEGITPDPAMVQLKTPQPGEFQCPACGHPGELINGACASCELQLE